MDNVLNRIIDIEKEAQNIIAQAERQREALPKLIEAEIDTLNKQFDSKNAKLIDEHKGKKEIEKNAAIAKLNTTHNRRMTELRDNFNTHVKKWENELFEEIRFG